jgi:multidrug efflux pump
MRLWIDPSKLVSYKLTIGDIQAALNRENIELPEERSGVTRPSYIVKTFGQLTTEDDFNNLILHEDSSGVSGSKMLVVPNSARIMTNSHRARIMFLL